MAIGFPDDMRVMPDHQGAAGVTNPLDKCPPARLAHVACGVDRLEPGASIVSLGATGPQTLTTKASQAQRTDDAPAEKSNNPHPFEDALNLLKRTPSQQSIGRRRAKTWMKPDFQTALPAA
jgi:hypothetical protein